MMNIKKPTLAILLTLLAHIVGQWSWVKETLNSFTPAIRWVIIVFATLIISFAFAWSLFSDWVKAII